MSEIVFALSLFLLYFSVWWLHRVDSKRALHSVTFCPECRHWTPMQIDWSCECGHQYFNKESH